MTKWFWITLTIWVLMCVAVLRVFDAFGLTALGWGMVAVSALGGIGIGRYFGKRTSR